MTLKNLTEFVQLCENRLGWAIDLTNGVPAYKQRNIEIGKIKRQMLKNGRITLENLEIAVEYSWQKRLPIKSPVGICYRIDDALAWAYKPKVQKPLEQRRLDAIREELGMDRDDTPMWVGRLQRAFGDGVDDLLKEWEESRRVGSESS